MKFNFRKIASVIASAVMLSSTVALAAAVNYPAPFVQGGNADVAIVYGANAANTDLAAATDLGSNLATELAKQTATSTTTSASVTGEAAPLYTGSSKLFINDSLNNVKSVITKSEMPVLLKDGSFSGNVDATYTQTIEIGSNPKLLFGKVPTSSDDPLFAYQTSTTRANYIYNASATFNKAVNISHADSKNQQLILFGQTFTVSAATDATNLVLLKEATKINFDSGGVTSSDVTIGGKKYTVEMVSASTTTAIVKVTDENGNSDQKEISEGYSKKVNGVTIAVNTADSNNLKYTASIVAGAEKITLTNGAAVTYGETDSVMDGTYVTLTGGTTALTKIGVSIYAANSDKDAIKPGESFVDPLFGSFKVDFSGLNVPENSSAREDIKVKNSGDDKMSLQMIDASGNDKTIQWAYNSSSALNLQHDTDGHNINVIEMTASNRSDMIVVGNEDEGHLIKVSQVVNQTTGYSQDKVTFQDVFSGGSYETTLTGEGSGTVTIGGKPYTVTYQGASDATEDSRIVRLNYPDSSGNDVILYPTIQTSKGAKVAFYKPLTINLTNWNGAGPTANATNLKFPNGADAYQSLAVIIYNQQNVSIGGTNVTSTGITSIGTTLSNTGFTFNFTYVQPFTVRVNLISPEDGTAITDPAIMYFEEKDDNNRYEGGVITLEPGTTGDDGMGVSDVIRTFQADSSDYESTMASDSKKSKEADLWGVTVIVDSSDSDQKTATLSYPDEQVYAQVYISKTDASVIPGQTGGGSSGGIKDIGSITVEDSEIASVKDKNLIVIGGSCINSVAAKMLGSDAAVCGADFTTKTGVGAGQFLIQAMASPYNAAKTAVLVAGFNAGDTSNAATYLRTQKPATDVAKKYKGTSSTSAELVTTSA